jgi:diaminopimelate decarboxylase
VDQHVVRDAIKKYGSPLYLYDGDKIEDRYKILKESLPSCFEIFYSIKANPLIGICQILLRSGGKAEAASAGELYTALVSGFPPEDIIFTSPGKTEEEIEYAVESNIYCINIESIQEMKAINQIAACKSKKVNIALRINPDFDYAGTDFKMTGVPTQFGIDIRGVPQVFEALRELPNVRVIGVHVYGSSQNLNSDNIVANSERIIKLALELSEKYKFKLEFLDIGGGFGIPYFPEDEALDLDALRRGMEHIWKKYGPMLEGTRIAVESGRFLTADQGVFITRVLYSKECKGKQFRVCDGGYNLHPSPAYLARFGKSRFPVKVLCRRDREGIRERATIAGPSCAPVDILAADADIDKTEPGDYILLEKSGAYGMTNSPLLFLSHPQPAEAAFYKGKLVLLRKRGNKEDFIKGQESIFEDL